MGILIRVALLGVLVSFAANQFGFSPIISRKWFAWLLPRLKASMRGSLKPAMCAHFHKISGNVLEIGPGTGDMLECFVHHTNITQWVGIEPNPYFKDQILENARKFGVPFPVVVHSVGGEDISKVTSSRSFDAAFSAHVLCSIPQEFLAGTFAGLHHALKPNAPYFFFDHTSAHDNSSMTVRAIQSVAAPIQYRIADGCEYRPIWELAYDDSILRTAGFSSVTVENVTADGVPPFLAPHVRGVARA